MKAQLSPAKTAPAWPGVKLVGWRTLPGYSFVGPLLLLLAGLAFATITAPGAWPDGKTITSIVVAGGIYFLAVWLARTGRGGWAAKLIIVAALALTPLAFGPSPLTNRKVTAYNDWAYALGANLPPIIVPAPNPNGIGALLVAGLGLAAAATLRLTGRKRWLAGLALALLCAALMLTASRSGWIAGAGALVFLARGKPKLLALLAGIGVAAMLLLAPLALAPPMPGQPAALSLESVFMRSEVWGRTLGLIAQQPLTGFGPGRFPAAYAASAAASGDLAYNTTHNTLLELWADAGLPGLLAFAWAALLVLQNARSAQRSSWLRDGLLAALLAFAIHGLVETDNAIVWSTATSVGYLLSPLPFALLGLLDGEA